MGTTQLDMIRRQAEAAVRSKASGAAARLRREASLVNQASRLTGKALRDGEEALRSRRGRARRSARAAVGATVATAPPPVRPAADGYVRRSPVQPVHEAADYRRRLVLRGVLVVVLAAAVCVGVFFLNQLGILGR